MRFPTIHINGTDGNVLFREYMDAAHSLQKVIEELEKVTVNGRDYYPQGGNAASEAYDEHKKRLESLRRVRRELIVIAGNIAQQQLD